MFRNYQMNINPSVAVVILNWNGRHFLEKYLPSVFNASYPKFFVVVADNHSTDDSISFLKTNFAEVKVISLEENFGFSKGYNLALKQITADYYVLLNSDVEVTKFWIDPVIDLMEKNKNIAACQPKILSEKNKDQFEYAGASGGWIDKFGYPFCRGRIFDFCEKDDGQYDDASEIFWASGAAMFVRSSLFHESGGLDETFFAHQEEIDFCWRLQNAGFSIFVEPKSVVYHLGGGSLEQGNKRKVFLNFRNNLLLIHKNLPASERFWKISSRHFLNVAAALQFLWKAQFANAWAVMHASASFYKWRFSNKKSIGTKKKLKKMQGVYAGSIVKEYFLKKKKRFSEIVQYNK